MFFFNKKSEMPSAETALAGRDESMPVPAKHYVNGNAMAAPFPEGMEMAMFGMGCFWGAERKFWQAQGVYSTAVGYSAGYTPNPTYEEVCSGMTGHNEVVRVIFDPSQISLAEVKQFEFINGAPTKTEVDSNSSYLEYRVKGDFITSFDFSQYPFESHALPVQLEHNNLDVTQLVYEPDPTSNIEKTATVAGWNIGGFQTGTIEHAFTATNPSHDSTSASPSQSP